MMKILLNTLLILAASASLMAQSFGQRIGKDEAGPKGNILVYGSLDYSKNVTPAGSASEFGTSPNASIPLGVGYFINNNDLIGVNFAFAQQKADSNVNSRQSEVGIWYSPSVMLGKYFGLIAQFDAHYVWGEQNNEKYDGYRLRAYPMLGVFLGNGWALKFKFGELSMLSTKRDAGWSHDYVAGLSGATFGTGISKTFKIRK
ncbi:hypothetical protein ACT4R9_04585 [Ornithobacterium rhinotracheale]|uniref:hypothetical protein n=1 Tax=Ornithobacterium rhinotracheale TaxID=28251 RepID=UPI001FF2A518|nr:hypothetical protein [Ornithobacterium rhinotracheale]MCK0203008.1 hypothetical protein [Ornithobacterium rhinotracheale]